MTVSWASSEGTARSMRANRGRDTLPELRLRRRLHAAGLRYRVDYPPVKGLRRRADVVFTRQKIAVFIDGCFWHGCPQHYTSPKTNAEFWRQKVMANMRRDLATDERLRHSGWTVLRFWEHEPLDTAVASIIESVTVAARQRR